MSREELEISREERITRILVEHSKKMDAAELFPAKYREAAEFAIENLYAFYLVCCFDRQMPSDITWTIQ